MESFASILNAHYKQRSTEQIRWLLERLTVSFARELGATFEITDWTVDAKYTDNGADVRFGTSNLVGSRAAGVVAFLHEPGRGANVNAFLLAFDQHGNRLRPHEEFCGSLTPSGWTLRGWGPDANYEWESYTDDARWRRQAVWTPIRNQHEETVRRLKPQIYQTRNGLNDGKRPSDLFDMLTQRGLGTMEMMVVMMKATGLGLGDVKGLGRWTADGRMNDADGFDDEVRRLLAKSPIDQRRAP